MKNPRQNIPLTTAIRFVLSCVPETSSALTPVYDPLYFQPALENLVRECPSAEQELRRIVLRERHSVFDIVKGAKGQRNDVRGHKSVVGLFMLAGGVATEGGKGLGEQVLQAAKKIQNCFPAHDFLVSQLRQMEDSNKEAILYWFQEWITCQKSRDQASWSEIVQVLIEPDDGARERLYANQNSQLDKIMSCDSDERNNGKRALAEIARTHRTALIMGSTHA